MDPNQSLATTEYRLRHKGQEYLAAAIIMFLMVPNILFLLGQSSGGHLLWSPYYFMSIAFGGYLCWAAGWKLTIGEDAMVVTHWNLSPGRYAWADIEGYTENSDGLKLWLKGIRSRHVQIPRRAADYDVLSEWFRQRFPLLEDRRR